MATTKKSVIERLSLSGVCNGTIVDILNEICCERGSDGLMVLPGPNGFIFRSRNKPVMMFVNITKPEMKTKWTIFISTGLLSDTVLLSTDKKKVCNELFRFLDML